MSTKVIDISKWQSSVGFLTAKSKGIAGAICRAAYGTTMDTKFLSHTTGANAAGLITGAYAFATYHYAGNCTEDSAVEKAVAQANALISILQKTVITGPVALDLELESGKSTSLGKAAMTATANAYMDVLAAAGYTPYLYCSISWPLGRMIPDSVNYPLWIAYYNGAGLTSDEFPTTTYGQSMTAIKDRIALWQYSSEADAAYYGVSGTALDINYAYRDISASGAAVAVSTEAVAATSEAANTASESVAAVPITVGDIVLVTGQGKSSASGTGRSTKNFISKCMKVLKIKEGTAYPYACSTFLSATLTIFTTGWYKAEQISK